MLAAEFLRGKRMAVFGAGYLGGAVIEQARAAGAAIWALTRNASRAAELAVPGVTVVEADLAERDWHAQVPSDAEFIVNCVGAGGGGVAGYRRSYVAGLASLREWARGMSRPGALVYTSSTSVYPQDGGVTVTEDAEVGGDERAALLLEAERQALAWPGPAVVLRLAGLYGPGRHHLLDALRDGLPMMSGRPENRLNLIHRDDAARAILAALAAADDVAGQIFNIADNTPVPKADVVSWLAAQLGVPRPGFSGQPAPGRRRATPDRLIDNTKARQRLDWQPVFASYRDGYRSLLALTDGGA